MKPLPKEEPSKEAPRLIPSLPLNSATGSYSKTNRRASACTIQRVYPWLLFASTAVAATFCLAYISKPIILAGPSNTAIPRDTRQVASNTKPILTHERIAPDGTNLPGEHSELPLPPTTGNGIPPTSLSAGYDFEETNIRMQHILDAESPSGDIDRIVIDVPVLYESRRLRWTQQEAAEARLLLERLTEHQEKTRNLRDEGKMLLQAWNGLIDASIPAQVVRADSPSLSTNQRDIQSPITSDSDSTIKIQRQEE